MSHSRSTSLIDTNMIAGVNVGYVNVQQMGGDDKKGATWAGFTGFFNGVTDNPYPEGNDEDEQVKHTCWQSGWNYARGNEIFRRGAIAGFNNSGDNPFEAQTTDFGAWRSGWDLGQQLKAWLI